MLEAMTAEQDAMLDTVAEEYIRSMTEPDPYDAEVVAAWLRVVYAACDTPPPRRVEVADSPMAALTLASSLLGTKQSSLDGVGLADAGWVARYDAYHRVGVVSEEEVKDVLALRAFLRCAWDHLLLDDVAIVVRRPASLRVDTAGDLHCDDGPAIMWADGNAEYAHHGVWISERIALSPRMHTREEYLAISDTEQRRALSERAGWEWVADLLGATVIDRWTDAATGLAYELMSHDVGKLLRKESPTLQTGARPWYVEPVHEDLVTAQAARKWQAVGGSVADVEADPDLTYEVET